MRLILFALTLTMLAGGQAMASSSAECLDDPQQCGWTASVNGSQVANGTFVVDGNTGDVGMSNGPMEMVGPNGDWQINVGPGPNAPEGTGGVGGNIDPEIVFGVGATNNSSGPLVFAFAFSLPLGGFPVPISTEAALAMTLTASSGTTGHLTPTGGKVVDSQDIRVVPFQSVDKGVDIGDPFDDPAGGLATITNDLVTGSILAGGPFDLMSVVITFVLADDAQLAGLPGQVGVGMSGRVTQLPVPEPSFALLLGAGLLGLGLLRRHR